jgi:signal transduction histidine kinase
MSLKLKVSLLVAGLMAGAVGALTALLLWSEERALAAGMRDRQQEAAAALAEVCRDGLIGEQFLPLANYLKRLRADPDVLEASCLDEGATALGHTDAAWLHRPINDPRARAALDLKEPRVESYLREGTEAVEAAVPVLVAGRRAGAVRILFSGEALRARFKESLARARKRILTMSLGVLAAGALGGFLLTSLTLRPLRSLVNGARTIGSGKLDHRIVLEHRDELGLLAGEFNQMADKLGELDRMKQDFVSGVTHDLKSPLASIKVAVDTIQQETEELSHGRPLPAPLADSLLRVREGLERQTRLVTSLLDVAHIESLLTLDKRPVNLEELADRVVRAFHPIARQKGVEMTLLLESDIRPFQADEAKLERTLANLVGNAVKFTEKGRVTVRLKKEGDAAVLSVEDTGPGIPPESMENLFSKFFRAAGTKAKEGTGLGLSIAKGFVEAHGGALSVESQVGRGTVFTLRLPAAA